MNLPSLISFIPPLFPSHKLLPYISFILIHKIPGQTPCVVTLVARIGPSQNYDAYIFVNRGVPFYNFTFYSENQGQNWLIWFFIEKWLIKDMRCKNVWLKFVNKMKRWILNLTLTKVQIPVFGSVYILLHISCLKMCVMQNVSSNITSTFPVCRNALL